MTDYIMVLVTTEHLNEAEVIGKRLVEEKLAACVNVLDGVNSLFFWKDKFNQSSESLMLIKTKAVLFEKLQERIEELHNYDVPEIIALPIIAGNDMYLSWLNGQCE